jgi:prephenate dehydrogenase
MSAEPQSLTVAIIGLGLIGGSLARDLAQRGAKVLGYDRETTIAQRGERDGILTALSSPSDAGAADVVVIAVPIEEALSLLPQLAPSLKDVRLLTDVCSTKASIARAAEKLGLARVFVGSHPMAGDHRSGWDASRRGLFANARTYVCATKASDERAIALAERLWKLVGADPQRIDATAHDREVAWTSHLPHVASAALASALAGASIARDKLGPGGRDATRLAGSDPELWTGIALDNATELLPALEAFEQTVRAMHDALSREDSDALRRHFDAAHTWSRAGQ